MFRVHNNSAHVNCLKDVSAIRHSAEVKRTHKFRVGDKLLNEYENNPGLIGGAFATIFPLGLTNHYPGNRGPLHSKLVQTWLMDARWISKSVFPFLKIVGSQVK